jgi:hypothetical protein
MVRTELLDRFATIRGFCNETHVRLPTHERSDPLAEDGMIVHR